MQIDTAALAHDGVRILGSKLGSSRPAVDVPALAGLYLEGRLLPRRADLVALAARRHQRGAGSVPRGEALRALVTF